MDVTVEAKADDIGRKSCRPSVTPLRLAKRKTCPTILYLADLQSKSACGFAETGAWTSSNGLAVCYGYDTRRSPSHASGFEQTELASIS